MKFANLCCQIQFGVNCFFFFFFFFATCYTLNLFDNTRLESSVCRVKATLEKSSDMAIQDKILQQKKKRFGLSRNTDCFRKVSTFN